MSSSQLISVKLAGTVRRKAGVAGLAGQVPLEERDASGNYTSGAGGGGGGGNSGEWTDYVLEVESKGVKWTVYRVE